MTSFFVGDEHEYYVSCEDLFKIYKIADLEVVALRGLDFKVRRGEFMALVGASGSGKSTLLNILAGLDQPSAGRAFVGGRDLLTMSNAEMVEYRRGRAPAGMRFAAALRYSRTRERAQ